MTRNRKKKEDFEKDLIEQKKLIENILLNSKYPLTSMEIREKQGIKIPERTVKGEYRKLKNPKYTKAVSKYIQTYLYDKNDFNKRTLCSEGKVFRLEVKDFFEYKKEKVKFSAKEFLKSFGLYRGGVRTYYFAIPKTYYIKTKIFDETIRDIFLNSKDISKYIEHKEEIEQLLDDAVKFMTWIEITPNNKKERKNLYKSNNFSQFIIDYICEGKEIYGWFNIFVDHVFAPILGKIEDLLFMGNPNESYINIYRILRRELYERKIFELPKDYLKRKKLSKEQFYKQEYEETNKGIIFSKILEQQMKKNKSSF